MIVWLRPVYTLSYLPRHVRRHRSCVLCQVVAALWDVVPADTPPVAGSSQTVGGSCGRTAKGSPRVWRGDSACGQTQAQPCGPLQSRVGFVCRHFSCEKVKLKLLVGVRVHALSESLSWEKTGEVACSGAAPPFKNGLEQQACFRLCNCQL